MSRLKPEDFKSIEALVTESEKKTTAEIVPLIISRANDYSWIHSVMAFEGMLLGILGGGAWAYSTGWPLSYDTALLLAFAGAFVGLGLSFIPKFARLSIGKGRLASEVHTRAFMEFVNQGCANTKNRTGILIFVSLFEHRIEIIADRTVQEKMVAIGGEKIWETFCTRFSEFAKNGNAVKGLAVVIEELASSLAVHFPDDGSSDNHLPNRLRTDK